MGWEQDPGSHVASPRFLVPPAARTCSADFVSEKTASPQGGFGVSFTMVHALHMACKSQ